MRLSTFLPVTLAVALGAPASIAVAVAAAGEIERRSEEAVRLSLADAGQPWAAVATDGLQVFLTGTAPDEASRFDALAAAGEAVDGSRVVDRMDVAPGDGVDAPRFTAEILRNETGISLIGLVPASFDRDDLMDRLGRLANGGVTDLLEAADYPIPETWPAAMDFAIDALERMPRSKISVAANRVAITGIVDTPEARDRLTAALRRDVPDDVDLTLDVTAPRPVITPFTVRFVIDREGARFDACAAETEPGRARLAAAAEAAGARTADCEIGLGQPTSQWAAAAVRGIEALAELGSGAVTFSDADVSLVVPNAVPARAFDRTVAELEADLPPVFSLTAIRLDPEPGAAARSTPDDGPAEFQATLSPEGLAWMRGRLPDTLSRQAVESFAKAHFGAPSTDMAARLDADLPQGWSVRVLTALEGLSMLEQGATTVLEGSIELSGATGRKDAQARIARLLSDRLGDRANYTLDIRYEESLDPIAALPKPQECLDRIRAASAERKITFAPGSDDIDSEALETIDKVAEVLRDCQHVAFEITGHTDSQGRESMNLRLSQSRADAVLNAIMARRVRTGNLTAIGYGETDPIADNDTEDGREANRRIEFRLAQQATAEESGSADEQN